MRPLLKTSPSQAYQFSCFVYSTCRPLKISVTQLFPEFKNYCVVHATNLQRRCRGYRTREKKIGKQPYSEFYNQTMNRNFVLFMSF